MLQLFRQFSGKNKLEIPSGKKLKEWMSRWCSGLDPRIIKLREENRDRILKIIIEKIDKGEISDSKFFFENGLPGEQKCLKALEWLKNKLFHLRFAVRSPVCLMFFYPSFSRTF